MIHNKDDNNIYIVDLQHLMGVFEVPDEDAGPEQELRESFIFDISMEETDVGDW